MAFLLCHVLVNTSHFPTILPTNAPNLRKTSRYILKHINTRISPNPLQHRGLGDLTWHEWVHHKRIHGFLVRMRSAVRIRPAAPKRKPPGRVVFCFGKLRCGVEVYPRRGKSAQQLHTNPVTTTVTGFALFYRFSVLLDFPTDFPTGYCYACFCSVAMINLAISGFSCSSRYACFAVLSSDFSCGISARFWKKSVSTFSANRRRSSLLVWA